jgi:polysaccharide pyruvyl transferase WcaK-like protein
MKNQPYNLRRRTFLSQLGILTLASTLGYAKSKIPKRILLRSSWQTVNIGDIAHTPGVLRILETHLPEAEIYLWPTLLDNGVEALLRNRFPKLKIANDPEALKNAFDQCDFLLHSSGASLVAEKDVVRWHDATGKPYGIYGITLPPKRSSATEATPEDVLAKTIRVLSEASFVFFRDSRSLAFAKEKGCTCPVMEFGPDGAFACDLKDDDAAEAFLNQHGLEPGNFLCCIPRLRYTPYWTIPEKKRAFDPLKHARNEEMKEHDHAQLRQAIIEVTSQTNKKVLLCPEDKTQMQVGKALLYDKLPSVVRQRVVWRPNYWLTGEAISTYVRSAGLFGNEMHSAIMCVGHRIPAIVCRWAEQTTKGYMWEDIGLGNWLFNLDDEEQVSKIVPTVLEMAKDFSAAKAKAEKARAFVQNRQQETMDQLRVDLEII